MQWDVLETGDASAEANMEFDGQLLARAGQLKHPTLHIYGWERPSVTFGHFIDPQKVLNLAEAEKAGLDLARRPTGGGVVFHLWDLAFSVVIPASSSLYSVNTLENYGLVNRVVQEVVKDFLGLETTLTPIDSAAQHASCSNFCMARPTKYDVMLQEKKIAGAAQRKTKDGFLHQGTIALVAPDRTLLSKLLLPEIEEAMVQSTFPLLNHPSELDNGRKTLNKLLKTYFTRL